MRKVISFLFVLVAYTCSYAQQVNTTFYKQPSLKNSDTLIVINSYPINNRLNTTTENMPNPYKGMANQLTKIGKNGKGFDLYQSKPDNMIVLKPDSINLALSYIPNGYAIDVKILFFEQTKFENTIRFIARN